MVPKKIIKFAPKIIEIDRQYEMNNNAELDNGVYHNEEEGGIFGDSKLSLSRHGGARPFNATN